MSDNKIRKILSVSFADDWLRTMPVQDNVANPLSADMHACVGVWV